MVMLHGRKIIISEQLKSFLAVVGSTIQMLLRKSSTNYIMQLMSQLLQSLFYQLINGLVSWCNVCKGHLKVEMISKKGKLSRIGPIWFNEYMLGLKYLLAMSRFQKACMLFISKQKKSPVTQFPCQIKDIPLFHFFLKYR